MERNKKYYSSKQEKLVADSLGWKVVSGSGSRSLYPGDVQSDEWIGECKTHINPGNKIVFRFTVWKKIVEEATSRYKFPVLFVDDGSQKIENTWCMFSTRPAVEFKVTNFIYPINETNITFVSENLASHRKDFCDDNIPLLYGITGIELTGYCYISSLKDFINMFGER